jgi:hypothetical protein
MAIPFADSLQDGDFPVRSVGVYTYFNDIVFYAPRSVYALKGIKMEKSGLPLRPFGLKCWPKSIMQRSTWTLYPPGQGSTWIRRRIRSQIFFHRRFSVQPTQIMCRKFVEYLGTDFFSFLSNSCPVICASKTKRRSTKPSSNAQCMDNFI